MEKKTRVLFICVHNSGRSQMAEAFLRAYGGDKFDVQSAGLAPRNIHPLVIRVMKEINMDISQNTSDSVFDFYRQGRLYDYVITVCNESIENLCPVFPGITHRLHWAFPDPSRVTGTDEEKLAKIRKIRDDIHSRIMTWLKSLRVKKISL
jgi:arsenate reductase (thioredoxin)